MKETATLETRMNLVIVVLLQAVVYSGIWLWDEYVASYLTLIFPGIIFIVLLIATIADLIEPSRIPKWYYGLMVVSILTPLIIGGLFYYIYDGRLEWFQ